MSASGGVGGASAASLAAASGDGANFAVSPGEWCVTSTPGVGVAAQCVRAAGAAGVRHVCTMVMFGFSASTAVALTPTVTVNLRDGAGGVGPILASWVFTLANGVVAPFAVTLPGLSIVGSAATQMALEFSAGIGNLFETAMLCGFDA